VPNPGEEDPAELMGHVCPEAIGSEDYGRLVALLVPALADALARGGLERLEARTRLVIVLPAEEDRAALYDIEDFEEGNPDGPDGFVVNRVRRLVVPSLEDRQVQVRRGGHSAVIGAIIEAAAALSQNSVERVVICAADSLVDPATAQSFAGMQRLRTAASPDGFFPGECGAALVLETTRGARQRGASVLAEIGSSCLREEAPRRPSDVPSEAEPGEGGWRLDGRTLVDAITTLAAGDAGAVRSLGAIVDEFNGESVRAEHFWSNLAAAAAGSESLRQLLLIPRWSPAAAFGDVGAATGALHVCVAARAFARRYAPGKSMLVCNVSDSGTAGAMVVSAPAEA